VDDESLPEIGMVGPFWVVESDGRVDIIALTVPLKQAETFGDMLTVSTGHLDYWSRLAHRGARALREAGIPTAPIWPEYEEWPGGRVMYDCAAQRFIICADRQVHRPAFIRLIVDRFGIAVDDATVLSDDHYRSVRHLPIPN
jgi:hypothetical protein